MGPKTVALYRRNINRTQFPSLLTFLLVTKSKKIHDKRMRRTGWAFFLGGLLFLIGFFLGKGPSKKETTCLETEDPFFQKAQQCLRENRAEEAFLFLNRFIDERQIHCPETHFQLGQLSVKRDPILSIYHFQQYLLQAPNGVRSKLVLQLIETAKKEFSRSLPLSNRTLETPEFLQLTESFQRMREENAQLKKQLAQARFSQTPAHERFGENVTPVALEEMQQDRWYVVQHEDSLSKISSKMYGTAVQWHRIYEANRAILPSANSLKIGMKLRIPAWTPKAKQKP